MVDLEAQLAQAERLRNDAIALAYVPGLRKCTVCGFRLLSQTLDTSTGRVTANPEDLDCPNGCGPMVRVTERQATNEILDAYDQLHGFTALAMAVLEDWRVKLHKTPSWLWWTIFRTEHERDHARSALSKIRSRAAAHRLRDGPHDFAAEVDLVASDGLEPPTLLGVPAVRLGWRSPLAPGDRYRDFVLKVMRLTHTNDEDWTPHSTAADEAIDTLDALIAEARSIASTSNPKETL